MAIEKIFKKNTLEDNTNVQNTAEGILDPKRSLQLQNFKEKQKRNGKSFYDSQTTDLLS